MTDPDWPEGVDRIVLDEVDSTMAEAARRAPNLTRPTWIMARRQTAARGRRGKAWANPEGNLAATLVFRPDATPAEAALRSFLAANALHAALSESVEPEHLALKWPNDVLLNGGKVAGILLESTGVEARIDWLAIGVGVNLVAAPTGLDQAAFPPVSLAGESGRQMSPDDLLARLAYHMAREEDDFAAKGFAPARARWLAQAARLGRIITATTSRETHEGTFETIDETGQLVLSTPKGQVVLPAGDVFF